MYPTQVHGDKYKEITEEAENFSNMLANLGPSHDAFRKELYKYQRGEKLHPRSNLPKTNYNVNIVDYFQGIIKAGINLELVSATFPEFGFIEYVELTVSSVDCHEKGELRFSTKSSTRSSLQLDEFVIDLTTIEQLFSPEGYHLSINNYHYYLRLSFQVTSPNQPHIVGADDYILEGYDRFINSENDTGVFLPLHFNTVQERAILEELKYSLGWRTITWPKPVYTVNVVECFVSLINELRNRITNSEIYTSFVEDGVRRNIITVKSMGNDKVKFITESALDKSGKDFIISSLCYTGTKDHGTPVSCTCVDGRKFKLWVSNRINPDFNYFDIQVVINELDEIEANYSIYTVHRNLAIVSDKLTPHLSDLINQMNDVNYFHNLKRCAVYSLSSHNYLESKVFTEKSPKLLYSRNNH